jgi:hypothetical protein
MKDIITGLIVAGIISGAGAAESPAKAATPDAVVKEPAAITRTTVIPCPTPKPAFDHTKIDRTLKEPKYVSEKPIYHFFAFGPEGKSVMAMVLDESKGTGKGYDVYYVDLNFDRDITGEGERFACKKPVQAAMSVYKPAKEAVVCDMPSSDGTPTCTIGLSPALIKESAPSAPPVPTLVVSPEPVNLTGLTRKLELPDPQFDYSINCEGEKWQVRSALKSRDWHARLSMTKPGNVWSTDKARAPVYRFGGMDWDFRQDLLKGKTLKPGDALLVEAVKPFFAGSSPEVQQGGCYVYGGYTHARYSLESVARPGETNRVFFAGNTCCGGTHVSRILIPADFPPGRAEVVLSMDTPDSYLGRVVQRIPVTIANPDYGKPIKELDVTAALRKEFPGDTVVELFQGADLSAWNLGGYDGARDTYIGGEGASGEFVGPGTVGNILAYSHDYRNDLHVGTVRNKRPLLRFDLSLLPRETKVKKAFLRLMAVEVKPKVDRTTQVRLLKKRWHEELCNAQAAFGDLEQEWHSSWYHHMRFPIGTEVKWEKPYAKGDSDRVPEPVGTIAFAATGWDGLDLTATVQKWVAGETPNLGLILELANPQTSDYTPDVNIVSSDNPSFPGLRPRLVLVLEKGFKAVAAPAIMEQAPDLEAARARAKAENKLLLCNVLSSKSVTSWNFQSMLKAPEVQTFLANRFVEIRLDADKPAHRKVLDFYGVKYAPTALVIRPGATPEQDLFERVEPLRWNTRVGRTYSWFETPETYALHLEWLRTKGAVRMPWRRYTDGTLYRLDSHLFYQRFDGNGGMVLQ